MKRLVQVVALLLLITAPASATGVATWTLQGVASYAQALVAGISSGTGSGNATTIQGSPVSTASPTASQTLMWNGSAWEPKTLASQTESGNSTSLQGSPVSTASPTSSQVLTWDGNAWTPATPSDPDTGWLSGNATDQYSIPIWDADTRAWTARAMLPTGISALSAKQPLSITSSGTLQHLVSGTRSTLNPPVLNVTDRGQSYVYFDVATLSNEYYSNNFATATDLDTIADGNSATFRTVFDDGDPEHGEIEYYNDVTTLDRSRAGQVLSGYGFQIANTATPGPASWVFQAYYGYASNTWETIETVVATSPMAAGNWYYSPTTYNLSGYMGYRVCFVPASGSYVDIAELRFFGQGTEPQWSDCQPPGTFSAVSIAVGTSTLDASSSLNVVGSIRNNKVRLTPEGGVAILLTAGQSITKGQVLTASSTASITAAITPASEFQGPIGVAYETVATGSACWVVVAGIADTYFDSGGSVRGQVARTSNTAGEAQSDSNVPPATQAQHNGEIGHILESRTGAGLAKVVLHFN